MIPHEKVTPKIDNTPLHIEIFLSFFSQKWAIGSFFILQLILDLTNSVTTKFCDQRNNVPAFLFNNQYKNLRHLRNLNNKISRLANWILGPLT